MAEAVKTNISIHPVRRSKAKQAKRKLRHMQNRTARAALYSEFQGNSHWIGPKINDWHSRLNALSKGAGG